jgi:hypothetical protein
MDRYSTVQGSGISAVLRSSVLMLRPRRSKALRPSLLVRRVRGKPALYHPRCKMHSIRPLRARVWSRLPPPPSSSGLGATTNRTRKVSADSRYRGMHQHPVAVKSNTLQQQGDTASPWSVCLTRSQLPLISTLTQSLTGFIGTHTENSKCKVDQDMLAYHREARSLQNGPWISLGTALVRSPPTCTPYEVWN